MGVKKNTVIQETTMQELRAKESEDLLREVKELRDSKEASIVEIGKRLIILKETRLKPTDFRNFVENARIGYETASKYMKLVRKYGIDREHEENAKIVIALGIKKAEKLLRIVNLEERIKYIKENDLTNKSFKEVSDLVDKDYPSGDRSVAPWVTMSTIESTLSNQVDYMDKVKDTLKQYSKYTKDLKVKVDNNKQVNIEMEITEVQQELNNLLNRIMGINIALEEAKKKQLGEKERAKSDKKKEKVTS